MRESERGEDEGKSAGKSRSSRQDDIKVPGSLQAILLALTWCTTAREGKRES